MYPDRSEACSAGVEAATVDPRSVQAIGEIGIDISARCSKAIRQFQDTIFDLSDFCYRARQACPIIGTETQKTGNSGWNLPERERSSTEASLARSWLQAQMRRSLRPS
ncbi:MAG: hypothetical protein PHQ34_05230 [Methanothrix sp.]|nr:hypothetical protein [Methanothrix sp.]